MKPLNRWDYIKRYSGWNPFLPNFLKSHILLAAPCSLNQRQCREPRSLISNLWRRVDSGEVLKDRRRPAGKSSADRGWAQGRTSWMPPLDWQEGCIQLCLAHRKCPAVNEWINEKSIPHMFHWCLKLIKSQTEPITFPKRLSLFQCFLSQWISPSSSSLPPSNQSASPLHSTPQFIWHRHSPITPTLLSWLRPTPYHWADTPVS